MRGVRKIFVIGILGYWVIGLVGCASIREGVKSIAGISTKELEEGRKEAISKAFNYDYDTCYAKTQAVLKDIGAYIYAKDKNMIAIYLSEEDTTPVGIFFKEIDAQSTQIEVSSPSTYAKELIFGKLFSALEVNADEKK